MMVGSPNDVWRALKPRGRSMERMRIHVRQLEKVENLEKKSIPMMLRIGARMMESLRRSVYIMVINLILLTRDQISKLLSLGPGLQ